MVSATVGGVFKENEKMKEPRNILYEKLTLLQKLA